jgi:hypothetical protein
MQDNGLCDNLLSVPREALFGASAVPLEYTVPNVGTEGPRLRRRIRTSL